MSNVAQIDNPPIMPQFVPDDMIIIHWGEFSPSAPATAVHPFAPVEPQPTLRPYNQLVIHIAAEFEPVATTTTNIPIAATPNEFEQCCAPCIGAHGAPYLTAAEINAILAKVRHEAPFG